MKRDLVSGLESSPALLALQQFVRDSAEQRISGPHAWEKFERRLREKTAALEREILEDRLQQEDVDADRVRIDGVLHRRACRSASTYQSVSGPVRVERNLYRPCGKRGAKAVCPLELKVGIVAGEYTQWAARQMATMMASHSSAEAERVFPEIGVFCPSRSNLDRLPKQLSEDWEAHRVEWEEELRSGEVVPPEASSVAVALDGVLIPSRETPSPDPAPGKRAQGPRNFREVSCGAVSLHDREGNRLQTIRYARAPEFNKLELKDQLTAELRSILDVRPELKVVLLADGARDHWEFFDGLKRQGLTENRVYQLLDFWHVCEHLKEALDLHYGEQTPKSRSRFEALKVTLKEDEQGVDKVIRSLVSLRTRMPASRRKKLDTVIGFFRKHRSHMMYADAQRQGLPIGSGVVEASCKTLATQRLKNSGMRWSDRGAQAILTLRALRQSDQDRWDRGWRLLASAYHACVHELQPTPLRMCG